MDRKRLIYLMRRGFLFRLSRLVNFPLVSPDCLQINFTFRCNLRCRMCSMFEQMESLKKQGRSYELDVPAMKKVIREGAAMRIPALILIGGEPLLEPRLFELVTFANECGFSGVTVVTNATMFTEENIKRMFDSGLANLSVSIDAASDKSMTSIRGEGVFERILGGITLLNRMKKEKGRSLPGVVCVCTIMDQNIEELTAVVNLCRKLEVNRVIFQPVVGNNTDQRANDFSSTVFVPPGRIAVLDRAIDELIAYKKKSREQYDYIANTIAQLEMIKEYFRGSLHGSRRLACYAGFNRVQIVQEGQLYFCVNQTAGSASFGDVRSESLRALWRSRKAFLCRASIRRCASPCLQWCSFRDEFIEWEDAAAKEELFGRTGV